MFVFTLYVWKYLFILVACLWKLSSSYALVISSLPTGNVVLHPCLVANAIVSTLKSHQLHKQVFVPCIPAMFEKTDRWKIKSIIIIENDEILKTHEHVNLMSKSQSKLCFGEDSRKQTCHEWDHCTVCSMNSSPCHSYENQGMHVESTNCPSPFEFGRTSLVWMHHEVRWLGEWGESFPFWYWNAV